MNKKQLEALAEKNRRLSKDAMDAEYRQNVENNVSKSKQHKKAGYIDPTLEAVAQRNTLGGMTHDKLFSEMKRLPHQE